MADYPIWKFFDDDKGPNKDFVDRKGNKLHNIAKEVIKKMEEEEKAQKQGALPDQQILTKQAEAMTEKNAGRHWQQRGPSSKKHRRKGRHSSSAQARAPKTDPEFQSRARVGQRVGSHPCFQGK